MTTHRLGRLSRLVTTVWLTSALLGIASITPATGACVAPELGVQNRLQPGRTLAILGRYFSSECNDLGPAVTGGPGNPMANIRVMIRQGGVTHPLGHRDANKRFRFLLRTTLPIQLRPGQAVLRAVADGVTVDSLPVVVQAGGTGACSNR